MIQAGAKPAETTSEATQQASLRAREGARCHKNGRSEPPVPRAKVVALGFYPPPVDGQRLITQRMYDLLCGIADVAKHDLGAPSGNGAGSKLLSVARLWLRMPIWRWQGYRTMYLAPHSGAGLIYSLAIAALCRLLRLQIYVHYHSYKNIARRSTLMASFIRLCGARTVHIVLGAPMAAGLWQHYRSVNQIAVLSNAVFMPERQRNNASRGRRLRIGHLSNLSRAKGLDRVIDCMHALRARGVEADLILAGPTADPAAQRSVDDAIRRFDGHIDYLGPISPAAIERFYDSIDVFLFPTIYEHEAEPLVVIEALSFGIPVIATDRGCIDALLSRTGSLTLSAPEFTARAVEQLEFWWKHPERLAEASEKARRRFIEVRRKSLAELERLLLAISANSDPGHSLAISDKEDLVGASGLQ